MTQNIHKDNNELIALAEDFIRKTAWKKNDAIGREYRNSNFNPIKKIKLDLERLEEIKEFYHDVTSGRKIPNNDNRYTLKKEIFELSKIMQKLNEIDGDANGSYVPSGLYYYPPNGACGWHTNSNSPGKRVYLTYAEEGNKSFFRYYDNKNNHIVTKYDSKGWNINTFDIGCEDSDRFWHCVGSNTNRISIGFRKSTTWNDDFRRDKLDIYEKYSENMKNNVVYRKGANMFENFLYGKYIYKEEIRDDDFHVERQKTYLIKFINIDEIFITGAEREIDLKDIYWKERKNKNAYFYDEIDTNFPVILLKSKDNIGNYDYITIDGNERLCRKRSEGDPIVKAFVIEKDYFYRNLELLDETDVPCP